MFKINKLQFFIAIISASFFVSCGSKKDVVYLQDTSDFETIVQNSTYTNKFKVDDEISIFISTLNPQASAPFNLFKTAGSGQGSVAEQVDYLVGKDGAIDFPVLGKLQVVGLSSNELRSLLISKLTPDYLIDPMINIRLKNFTISVLGEVNRPGTYPVIGEQLTIFEALGYAGDLTIKGQRNNILVIRDFDGTFVHHRIDLRSKEAMKSPVFYLTQNDVIYVEPNQSGVTASVLDNRATIAISLLTVLITTSAIIFTRN